MPVKPVSIEIDEDTHAAAKAVAATRRQKVGEVYEEAMRRWLEWIGGEIASPFGDLTSEEERYLRATLAYLRGGPERGILTAALDEVVRSSRDH